jgi:hypothetical protein
MTDQRTSDLVAKPGGVMTDEVGAITGELTLRTEVADGTVVHHVQYKDADEWYVVTDSRRPFGPDETIDDVHTQALAAMGAP